MKNSKNTKITLQYFLKRPNMKNNHGLECFEKVYDQMNPPSRIKMRVMIIGSNN